MSEKKEIETITTASGAKIDLDPAIMIECLDDVDDMVNGHLSIISAVEAIIKRFIAAGLSEDEAAMVAMELQRRAGKKANNMSHSKPKEDAEENKTEEKSKE